MKPPRPHVTATPLNISRRNLFSCLRFRHYDMNPRGEERMGRTDGNVMLQLPNGFTKGTSVHTLGPDINTTTELRWQKPYVARYTQIVL